MVEHMEEKVAEPQSGPPSREPDSVVAVPVTTVSSKTAGRYQALQEETGEATVVKRLSEEAREFVLTLFNHPTVGYEGHAMKLIRGTELEKYPMEGDVPMPSVDQAREFLLGQMTTEQVKIIEQECCFPSVLAVVMEPIFAGGSRILQRQGPDKYQFSGITVRDSGKQ